MAVLDWQKDWDCESGLWWYETAGHLDSRVAVPSRVRRGPGSAAMLLVAAQAGALSEVDVGKVLGGLRASQILDGGADHGEFRQYLEEEVVFDTHSTFFTGLALCAFYGAYGGRLDGAVESQVRELLADMRVAVLRHVGYEHFHYPNEYLGDAVCAWLGGELLDDDSEMSCVAEGLERVADYWLEDGWGWGEHLSDIYGNICIDELSLLLLLGRRLPARLREKLTRLFHNIMAIDDFFAGGPRVPSIRLYAFMNVPRSFCYRDHIRPLPADALLEQDQEVQGFRAPNCCAPYRTASGGTWHPLAGTLDELGWHKLAKQREDVSGTRSRRIRCVGGSSATAFVDDDVRMGSLSRFPLMDSAEHLTWGLAWQCFPVSVWQRGGMWGYLQWEVLEDGRRRCHPAMAKFDDGVRAMTRAVNPPIFGRTYGLQEGGDLVALRVMPAIAAVWEELIDRFRLVGGHSRIVSQSCEEDWSQLVLHCGGREIAVQCLRLSGGAGPEQVRCGDQVVDWSVCYRERELVDRRGSVNLWGISLSGAVAESPVVRPDRGARPMPRGLDAQAVLIDWDWPGRSWKLRVDLTQYKPLQYVDGHTAGEAQDED